MVFSPPDTDMSKGISCPKTSDELDRLIFSEICLWWLKSLQQIVVTILESSNQYLNWPEPSGGREGG
jgi:hypothetical protein